MKCSNLNRCNKHMLIFFDNIYICKTCDSIFKKGTKHIKDILIKCCNRQNNKEYKYIDYINKFIVN